MARKIYILPVDQLDPEALRKLFKDIRGTKAGTPTTGTQAASHVEGGNIDVSKSTA